jgi:hypothetical protein
MISGASVGNYALFAGGTNVGANSGDILYETVDAYNKTLTRSNPAELSAKKVGISGASMNEYAVFAGGSVTTGTLIGISDVDAYTAGLIRITPDALSIARHSSKNTSLGNRVLFAGGNYNNYEIFRTVDVYENTLNHFSSKKG